jgi:hypothetical protein
MSRFSTRARLALLAPVLTVAALIPAGSAVAQAPANPWTPHANCPVDAPVMLTAPPSTFGTGCVSSNSPSGSIKIGRTSLNTRSTTLQFGLPGADPANPGTGLIEPATNGKTLVSAPVKVPGGVLGLMCPAGNPAVASLCRQVVDLGINRVTATVELAGRPSKFRATGALVPGIPLLDLPVKIHLKNPLLGARCYIGSNLKPIVLRPETVTRGAVGSVPEPNGFPVLMLQVQGSVLGDDSFAVPGATGCGPLGIANAEINRRQGLPSPSGRNELILNDADAHTALSQQGGQVLSNAWHASLDP